MSDQTAPPIFIGLPYSLTCIYAVQDENSVLSRVDISDWTVYAQGAYIENDEEYPNTSAPASIAVTFTCEVVEPQTGDDEGAFVLSLTAAQTATLNFNSFLAFDVILRDAEGALQTSPIFAPNIPVNRPITEDFG